MGATAQHLRDRALELRAVAARLERAPLLALHGAAGPDTWQCPAADEFLLSIAQYQARLLDAADDLVWQAIVLDRMAEDQEAADAVAVADPGWR